MFIKHWNRKSTVLTNNSEVKNGLGQGHRYTFYVGNNVSRLTNLFDPFERALRS